MDKSRLDTVDALLERLADSGFKGKIVLQTHVTPYLAEESPIRLEIMALPRSTPLVIYPERLEGTTALDWNSAAEKNNRVILRLEPQ